MKSPVLKTGRLERVRGFESHPLRHNIYKGEVFTMMRAMILCLAIAFVALFVFFGIHYGNEVGSEIKDTLKKLFG